MGFLFFLFFFFLLIPLLILLHISLPSGQHLPMMNSGTIVVKTTISCISSPVILSDSIQGLFFWSHVWAFKHFPSKMLQEPLCCSCSVHLSTDKAWWQHSVFRTAPYKCWRVMLYKAAVMIMPHSMNSTKRTSFSSRTQ